jgi:hypothetical protein
VDRETTFFSVTLMEERMSLVMPQAYAQQIEDEVTDDIKEEMSIYSDIFVPLFVNELPLGFGMLFCLL